MALKNQADQEPLPCLHLCVVFTFWGKVIPKESFHVLHFYKINVTSMTQHSSSGISVYCLGCIENYFNCSWVREEHFNIIASSHFAPWKMVAACDVLCDMHSLAELWNFTKNLETRKTVLDQRKYAFQMGLKAATYFSEHSAVIWGWLQGWPKLLNIRVIYNALWRLRATRETIERCNV